MKIRIGIWCLVVFGFVSVVSAQTPPPHMYVDLTWGSDYQNEDYFSFEQRRGDSAQPWVEAQRVIRNETRTRIVGLFSTESYCYKMVPRLYDGTVLPGSTEERCSYPAPKTAGAPLGAAFFVGAAGSGTPGPSPGPDPEPEPEPEPDPPSG